MKDKLKGIAIAVVAVAALAVGGAAIAGAGGGDGDDKGEVDKPISGGALGKTKAAALEHTGGGTVTATEVGDEESYYEVEVTRGDGSQVDVQLDRGFDVVGDESDGAGEDD